MEKTDVSGKTLANRLDNLPVKGWHWMMLSLLMLLMMVENYNQVSIAMTMPVIVRQWQLSPMNIGVLLSASSLGLLIGAFLFGFLTDILGSEEITHSHHAPFFSFCWIGRVSSEFYNSVLAACWRWLGLGGFHPGWSGLCKRICSHASTRPFLGYFLNW